MKKYLKEIIIILIQIFMFYIFPFFTGPTDAIGMVVIILISTFIFSILIATISKSKLIYLYPFLVALLFIPSVFIHYNETALIHSLWYLITSFIGLGIVKMFSNFKNNQQ